MKSINIYIVLALAMFTALASCQRADQPDEQQPAQIRGVETRSGATPVLPDRLYSLGVTAKLGSSYYLNNIASTMAANTGVITFNSGQWYYPLNRSQLMFYAFTPPVSNDVMTLTSGTANANDAILSNNGGGGTPGSSNSQVTQLVFSHVMTKLEVIVSSTDTELAGWTPTTFNFTMAGAIANGTYNITSPDGTNATPVGGTLYTIVKGINYLVPNGATLGNTLASLRIDDYTATTADLAKYVITQTNGTTPLILKPGMAYTLTFNIKRLHLESITLSLGNWTTVNVTDDDVAIVPQNRTLSLGAYTRNDINKIEVIDNAGDVFTGSVASGVATFVLAPPTASTVKLYTATGLLLSTNTGITLTSTSLSIGNMNSFGMLTVDPASAYDPVLNPYTVSTIQQFMHIDASQSYSLRQTANLNFENIQMSSINMNGSYDGNGFQINGVNVLGSGLFKEIKSGQTLINVRVASGCVVQNGSDTYVGGLCGKNSGTIVACVNEALIVSSAVKNVGGICGENAGQIVGCMNAGDIRGIYGTGSSIGGICGYNSSTATPTVVSALNVGLLRPTGTYQAGNVGGICGNSVSNASFLTVYWLTGTAEPTIGTAETAVNGTSLTLVDASDLSPQRIRDPQTVNLLNAAIPLPWSNVYHFTTLKITWPMPVKI